MIAVLTARGGSKRIPRKNIRPFLGRPIITYPISACIESGVFDDVVVSTDDEEIAEVARSAGARVPFMRSPANSDDYATTSDVLFEFLERYEREIMPVDTVCCVYPTAVLMTTRLLCSARSKLDDGADCVLPIVRFSFPPQRGMVEGLNGIEWWMPEFSNSRTQDLKSVFHDAGMFYMFRRSSFFSNGRLLAGNVAGLEIPESECQDIDILEDWKIAELKYERLMNDE